MFEPFDAPQWVSESDSRPVEYDYLVRRGMTGLVVYPWSLHSLDEVVSASAILHDEVPGRKLVVFARHCESDEFACWDAASSDPRVVTVRGSGCLGDATFGRIVETSHDTLWNWLRTVVETFVQHAVLEGQVGERLLANGVRPGFAQAEELVSALPETSFHLGASCRAPEWLKDVPFDAGYQVLRCRLVTQFAWEPWRFLPDVDLVIRTEAMSQVYPDRRFVVFAHRADDALACWDASRSDGVIYMVHNCYAPEQDRDVVTYLDMLQWFRHVVVEDYIALGEKWVQGQACGE